MQQHCYDSDTAATPPQQKHDSSCWNRCYTSTTTTTLQQQHKKKTLQQHHSRNTTAATQQKQHHSSNTTAAAGTDATPLQQQHNSSKTIKATQQQHYRSNTTTAATPPQQKHYSSCWKGRYNSQSAESNLSLSVGGSRSCLSRAVTGHLCNSPATADTDASLICNTASRLTMLDPALLYTVRYRLQPLLKAQR